VNKVHPYAELEREYITTDLSIRELCRWHSIAAHSSVVVQALKHKWAEKREAYQAKASDAFIDRHADRMADRQAEISDKALDAIDEAITKFRSDMQATAKKRIDGEWIEVPVMRVAPKDLALLIDRFEVLFDRPAHITEQHNLAVRSELPLDALKQLVELTRGRAAPPTSPLPRTRRADD
jgi:hypothetical protein